MEDVIELKTISAKFNGDILQKAVEEYFLKKTGKKAPEITNHSVSYASGKGDGYLGLVYRIKVDLRGDTSINLIGKGMPENITRRKTFCCETFFANEVFFFNKIVPAFKEFEKEKLGKDFTNSYLLLPDCFYAMSDGMNDFLVLEDLSEEGYSNAEKSKNLNKIQISEMLKIFGRFHAFSLALNYFYPEKFTELANQATETQFSRDNCMWPEKYIDSFSKCFKLAAQSEIDGKYIEKFEILMKADNILPKIFHAIETKDNKCVFNHGDPWITNFMFKGNDVKAIDFQLVRYGSPMLDISCVIFACTDQLERDQLGGTKGMFEVYIRELNHTVTSLGAPLSTAYTIEEMMNMWLEFGVLGFAFGVELVQLSLMDANDVQDLDRFDGDVAVEFGDIMTCKEVESKEGKQRLANLLKFAVHEGVI